VALDGSERAQQLRIADAPRLELLGDHHRPVAGVATPASGSGRLPQEARPPHRFG
jgi:hypothetical protein